MIKVEKMDRFEWGVNEIMKRNRDGSHATQSNRKRMLKMFVQQLKEAGYKTNKMQPSDLKGRHVNALVRTWKNDGVSNATMKNRMSNLRWLAEKIGKADMIKANEVYGIENRKYITNKDKSKSLRNIDMSKVESVNIRRSLALQQTFGLRREEAMKFRAGYALDGKRPKVGDVIKIKPSWSKGGRYREIPITNETQVKVLNTIIENLGFENSLIPIDKTYKEWVGRFERETSKAGIGQTHGLRHLYAQRRYYELTGFLPPVKSDVKELTDEQEKIDLSARKKISQELGHNRLHVTGIYLGSWGK